MPNEIIDSIIGSYDSTPASLVIGKNLADDAVYMYHEAAGNHRNVALRKPNRETRLLGSLVINREILGGHTWVTVTEGKICLSHCSEEESHKPSVRYILKTQGTNKQPREGVLDFYLSDDIENPSLCLSIGKLIHPDDRAKYGENDIIYLDVGPGTTTVSGNQPGEILQDEGSSPFGPPLVVANKLAPLLGDAGIEIFFSLKFPPKPPADDSDVIEIPNPHGGPVTPSARNAATNIAARL